MPIYDLSRLGFRAAYGETHAHRKPLPQVTLARRNSRVSRITVKPLLVANRRAYNAVYGGAWALIRAAGWYAPVVASRITSMGCGAPPRPGQRSGTEPPKEASEARAC